MASRANEPARTLRPKDVADLMTISLPTLWRWVKENPAFPRPRRLSAAVTVFVEAELRAYLAATVSDTARDPAQDTLGRRPNLWAKKVAAAPAPPAPAPAAAAETVTPIRRKPGRPRKHPMPLALAQTTEA